MTNGSVSYAGTAGQPVSVAGTAGQPVSIARAAGRTPQRTIAPSGGVSPPYRDLEAEKAVKLRQEKERIERKVIVTTAKVSALNEAQNALNTRGFIPAPTIQKIKSEYGLAQNTIVTPTLLQRLKNETAAEQTKLMGQVENYNIQAASIRQEIRPTEVQPQPVSFIDRGPLVSVQRAGQPVPGTLATAEARETIIARQQQAKGGVKLPEAKNPIESFILGVGESVYGLPGTETGYFETGEGKVKTLPYFTRKGGITQRAGEAFYGSALFGKEFGGRVAGPVGAGVGTVAGVAVGGFLGAFEAGPGTAIRALQKGAIEPSLGPFAGEVYSVAGTYLVGTRGLVKGISKAPKIVGKIPSALRFLERGKSIYAAPGIAGKAAVTAEKIGLGFNLGKTGARLGSYTGKAEKVGAALGKTTQIAGRIAKTPFVKYPSLGAVSIAAPSAGEAIIRGSYGEFAQKPKVETTIARGFERIQKVQASRGAKLPEFQIGGFQLEGTTGSLGSELGFGLLGERAPSLGGITRKEAKTIFLQEAFKAGLTGAEAEKAAKIATQSYFGRQAGGIIGLTAVESTTELGGRALIGKSIRSSLTGKAIGLGTGEAFKKTITTTAKTIPYFAGLGAYEGFVGIGTTELVTRRARTPAELPARVAADPLRFAGGAIAGAISAPLLGGTVIAGGTYKTLRKGSKLGAGIERGALGLGYALDPLEEPGDYLATVIGTAEPRFRVRTITGVSTQEAKKGVKVKTKVPISILEDITGISSVEKRPRGGIITPGSFTPSGVPTSSFIGTPAPVDVLFSEFFPQTVPETQTQTETELQEQLQQEVPEIATTFNVPVGVPSSKVGVPPFFPIAPFDTGGGGRGKGRGRKTFFNEFLAAQAILGTSLTRQATKQAKRQKSFFGFKKRKKSKKRR